MPTRTRSWLLAVASVAALGVLASPAESQRSAYPTLYVVYTMSCTFSFANDNGQPVTTIAPGNYEIDVRTPIAFGTIPLSPSGPNDMTACRGMAQFQLTGPGVSLASTVTGGCMADNVLTANFQPGATYVALDNNQPAVTRTVLTVASSGAPVAPTEHSTGSGSSQSTDIVGSAAGSVRAHLSATLSASGGLSLTIGGKKVRSLKAGRYAIRIVDRDGGGGVTLHGPKGALVVSGVKFIGTRSITVALKPGRWTYFSGLGPVRSFTVTG